MKWRRIKFIWGSSKVIRGRWYLGLVGLYERQEGKRGRALAVSVRGLLSWSLALGLVLYVAAATALFWLWERNLYNLLTYQDALSYPFRRAALQEKRGRMFIAQGTDLFRAKKFYDAATLLRLGLARQPRDHRARMLLARYYVMANQRALAQQVLAEGLGDSYPGRAYLEAFFDAAALGENFERVVAECRRYEAQVNVEGSLRDQRWLRSRKFAALGALGRWEEVLALAALPAGGELAEEHRILALLELGLAEEALAGLAEWKTRPGATKSLVVRLQIRALREAGHYREMEPAITDLRAFDPASNASAVYGVIQLSMAGQDTAADVAFTDYLFRFGGSAANLMQLAKPLAEIGDLPRLRRCVAAAAERGYPARFFHTLLIQLLIKRAEWPEARALLAHLPLATGREAVVAKIWQDWIEWLIDAATNPADPVQLQLLDFLRSRTWPLSMFRRSLEVLIAAGRLETSREAIAVAGKAFPASAWLQEQAGRVGELVAAREAAVPVAEVFRVTPERTFFPQLETALRDNRWDEADDMIRKIRQDQPAWLAGREPDLRLAQVRISQAGGEVSSMLASARLISPVIANASMPFWISPAGSPRAATRPRRSPSSGKCCAARRPIRRRNGCNASWNRRPSRRSDEGPPPNTPGQAVTPWTRELPRDLCVLKNLPAQTTA